MSNSAFTSNAHTQNTDAGTTEEDFTVNSGAATKLVLTGGSNTFTIVDGTASLDIAAGAAVNIDDDITVSAELHVEAATHVNQDLTSDAAPAFEHVHVNGVAFPASQSASADANTLDDYEEGTWTPVLKFGTDATGITYNTQIGVYTKIGNLVHIKVYIVLTSKGAAVGSAYITGLPFNCGDYYPMAIGYVSATTFANMISNYTESGAAFIVLGETTEAGAWNALTNADFANSSAFMTGGTYRL